MSHTGNWSRNPRKLALERSRQREQAAAEAKEKVAREGGSVVTFYDHGPDLHVMGLTPCTTFNLLHARATVVCAGCAALRELRWAEVAHTRLSHTPWPQVMPHLVCQACGDRPLGSGLIWPSRRRWRL